MWVKVIAIPWVLQYQPGIIEISNICIHTIVYQYASHSNNTSKILSTPNYKLSYDPTYYLYGNVQ